MGRRHPERHITDPRNARMKETSRRERRMETTSEEGQGAEGAEAPWIDGWMGGSTPPAI